MYFEYCFGGKCEINYYKRDYDCEDDNNFGNRYEMNNVGFEDQVLGFLDNGELGDQEGVVVKVDE